MDLYSVLVQILAGILLLSQGSARRLAQCRVKTMRDMCGFAQDRSDSFDWTVKRWIIDVKRAIPEENRMAVPEEPHGQYLSAAKPPNGFAGQNAILHTPKYHPHTYTHSTLSIRLQIKIKTNDNTRLNIYVSQDGRGKVGIYTTRSQGQDYFGAFRNITVMTPFRISFEAVMGNDLRSSVDIDDVEIDIFPQTLQTGNTNTLAPPTVASVTKDSGTGKNDEDTNSDEPLPMCFVIAMVSTSILGVFLVMCCILCIIAVRTNSFSRRLPGHNYEVIYAEQSTTHSSMESSLQLSLRRQRGRTTTTTLSSSSRFLHRISCSMSSSRLSSNQSSIYAEIPDTDCDRDSNHEPRGSNRGQQVEVFFVDDRSTGTSFPNSFFSTLSTTSSEETIIQEPFTLNIPDKVKEALFLPYLPSNQRDKRASPVMPWRAPQDVDTGWVDNIIYEGGFECNNVPASGGRQAIGLQTLRPQPSPKEMDGVDNRKRLLTM